MITITYQDDEGYHVTIIHHKLPSEVTTQAREDAFDTYYNHVANCTLCIADNPLSDDCTIGYRLWQRFRNAK